MPALSSANLTGAATRRRFTSNIPKPVDYWQQRNRLLMADMENVDATSPRVRLNVSGMKFETRAATLARFPNTLLGNVEKRRAFWDTNGDEYFLDRPPLVFPSILFYYQSHGKIRRSHDVAVDDFIEEMMFFQLGDEAINMFKEQEGLTIARPLVLPSQRWQRVLWLLLEYPESSFPARVLGLLNMFVIILSIVAFCAETLARFDQTRMTYQCNCTAVSVNAANASLDSFYAEDCEFYCENPSFPLFFTAIETACISWFTLELLLRFMSCPDKCQFWSIFKHPLNWIDLVAILPFYIDIVTKAASSDIYGQGSSSLSILRVVRLVRVFRILKLSRHSKGLKILGQTFQASVQELTMLVVFLIIGITLFASATYYVEQEDNHRQFSSIPASFWWGVVTMTTVGFGDVVPKTVMGKMIGSLCALAGVLTLALPVPVIVSNFNYFYQRAKESAELEREFPDASTTQLYGDLDRTEHVFRGWRPLSGLGKGVASKNNQVQKVKPTDGVNNVASRSATPQIHELPMRNHRNNNY